MKKIIFSSILAATFLFSGCSTDLDVIGDYKETIVVYGLLDQAQPKQYIKINKAFLGAGNAYEYAALKDSTQFAPGELVVTITRMSDGLTQTLSPDGSIPKDPGIFYSNDQTGAIYSMPTPVGFFNTNSQYQLKVRSNETGNEVTAVTSLISDISNFIAPNPAGLTFAFAGPCVCPNFPFNINWNSARNARLYQAVLRLNYVDSTLTGNDTNYLDYQLPELRTQNIDATPAENLGYSLRGRDFYSYIGASLSNYSGLVHRKSLNVELRLIAGSDELTTFMDVNKPSTGIIQERPEYSNINGGMGIFSARLNRTPLIRMLDGTSQDSLACGQYTKLLRFVNSFNQMNPDGSPVTCP